MGVGEALAKPPGISAVQSHSRASYRAFLNVRFRPKADIGIDSGIVHQTAMTLETSLDERIIWQGQPTQGIRFGAQDIFAVPFAAFWVLMVLAIFLLGATGELREVDSLAYIILPIFLLFGLHMLIGRFLVDRAARRRTHYYLTNQRAIIESGLFLQSRRSVSLAALPEIHFRSGRKGRGTIQFGPSGMFGMMPPSWPGASQFLPPAFNDIDGAESVYKRALAAQRDAQVRR